MTIKWGDLLYGIRESLDNIQHNYSRNQEVFVIDEESPKIFKGRVIGNVDAKTDDPKCTLEIEGEDYRTLYPHWCIFTTEKQARDCLGRLNTAINTN